ncbi:MAG TPA: cytochrome c biogenesis protein CcsA, partial [Actinomycetota bacterium]
MTTAEQAMARMTARRGERVLGVLALAALAASAVMSLAVAPPDAEQGEVQRLMYVHVPSAWLAYLAFTVVFVSSIAYLRTKKVR